MTILGIVDRRRKYQESQDFNYKILINKMNTNSKKRINRFIKTNLNFNNKIV